jgi:flagellar hook-length control protein FliK
MPKVVENVAAHKTSPRHQPRKAAPREQSEQAQTFDQALTNARPKVAAADPQPDEPQTAAPSPEAEQTEAQEPEVDGAAADAETKPELFVSVPSHEAQEPAGPRHTPADVTTLAAASAPHTAPAGILPPPVVAPLDTSNTSGAPPLSRRPANAADPVVSAELTVDSPADADVSRPHQQLAAMPLGPDEIAEEHAPTKSDLPTTPRQPVSPVGQTNVEAPQPLEPTDNTPAAAPSRPLQQPQEHEQDASATEPQEVVKVSERALKLSASADPGADVSNLVFKGAADESAPRPQPATPAPAPPATPPAAHARELDFAGANHDRIVTSLRTELLPNGGTMRIRLDPPELGALQVTVRMLDGVMTASFETSTEQATRMLSHTLGQLKQVLETQGVAVERLQVQQSARHEQGSSGNDDPQQRQPHPDDQSSRQEQQRREMLRRLWRRMGLIHDPLDMVA